VKSHFLLRLSGLWRQYPWVAFHHGYTRPNKKMELYNRLDRWSLRKAAQVVTVTAAFERELLEAKVPPRRILVLHNAISPDWASGISSVQVQELRLALAPKGEKLLLSVGRLSQEKAHQDLLEALRLLSASRPDLDWRLAVVGEGPERARLEDAAAPFHGCVTFAGQISDVRAYYAAADLFVLPSHSEGSPNVLLEAMAARLPIVATAVGGIPEIVTGDEHALLVPPRQPDALARAIERMLDSPELAARLVEAAAARIAHKYSPEARTRHLAELYARLAASGTAAR
jgi:glycosyltransferase involved in cell wall biosynthesis